jgi:hypothetical protein
MAALSISIPIPTTSTYGHDLNGSLSVQYGQRLMGVPIFMGKNPAALAGGQKALTHLPRSNESGPLRGSFVSDTGSLVW